MLPLFSPLLRSLPSSTTPMARIIARSPITVTFFHSSSTVSLFPYHTKRFDISSFSNSSVFGRKFHALCAGKDGKLLKSSIKVFAEKREYRKVKRRATKSKEKELELSVSICIEDELPDDPEISVFICLCLSVLLYCFSTNIWRAKCLI